MRSIFHLSPPSLWAEGWGNKLDLIGFWAKTPSLEEAWGEGFPLGRKEGSLNV